MAKTSVTTANALTQKLWEAMLFEDTKKESYFYSRFMSEDGKSIIQVKSDLTKKKGDNITFGIRMRLSGAGVTSGQTLEGNEESLTTYSQSVSLERYRHAVRDAGALDRARPVYDMDSEARSALEVWGGEKIDKLCFDTLATSLTSTFRPNARATDTALVAGDTLTLQTMSKLKALAKTGIATVAGRAQTPIRPVRVDGKEYYVLVVHPFAAYDVKNSADALQARREADARGADNPLFTGATLIWDGVILHEHENIVWTTNAGGVNYSKGLFMGQQAGVWAWGERPSAVAQNFDYDEEHGFAWRMTAGVAKTAFNSKDYAVIGCNVANSAIAIP
jgi:N4-gp56 family major capsid protein